MLAGENGPLLICYSNFAARRGGAPIQFFQNWENDIFNPILWIEDIVFAYNFVPISVAVNRKFCEVNGQ